MIVAVAASILSMALLQQEPEVPRYDPGQTRVALLPIVNTSGEKWKELRGRQETAAAKHLYDEFSLRGFVVIPDKETTEAIGRLNIDLQDEENHNRATLFKLGEELSTTLVLFAVLTDTRQDGSSPLGGGYGVVQFKVWFLDAQRKQPIFSGKSASARSARASYKTSDRQVWAVALALDDALKDFLKDYKKSKA